MPKLMQSLRATLAAVAAALLLLAGTALTAAPAAASIRADDPIIVAIEGDTLTVNVSSAAMEQYKAELEAKGDYTAQGSRTISHKFSHATSVRIYNAVKAGSGATLTSICLAIPGLPVAIKAPICAAVVSWLLDKALPALGSNQCYKIELKITWRWWPPKVTVKPKISRVTC
jgi:hypothetical protein